MACLYTEGFLPVKGNDVTAQDPLIEGQRKIELLNVMIYMKITDCEWVDTAETEA